MIHKYKLVFWNTFCAGVIVFSALSLIPYVINASCEYEDSPQAKPVVQTNTTRKVWKRGKFASETTIKEKGSKTQIDGKPTHTVSGWTHLKWRKDEHSKS